MGWKLIPFTRLLLLSNLVNILSILCNERMGMRDVKGGFGGEGLALTSARAKQQTNRETEFVSIHIFKGHSFFSIEWT
jgi:hypothetical protein